MSPSGAGFVLETARAARGEGAQVLSRLQPQLTISRTDQLRTFPEMKLRHTRYRLTRKVALHDPDKNQCFAQSPAGRCPDAKGKSGRDIAALYERYHRKLVNAGQEEQRTQSFRYQQGMYRIPPTIPLFSPTVCNFEQSRHDVRDNIVASTAFCRAVMG
jgi:hypothetical protein